MQNSSSRLRLAVEAAVIVGSILLAFGIDASWDARLERLRERSVLLALQAELLTARQAFLDHSGTLRAQQERTAGVISVLSRHRVGELPTDSVRVLAGGISPPRVFQPPRAALNDLLRGGVTLIRSDTLRRAIAAYEQALARDVEAQEQLEDLWLNRLAPYRYENGAMDSGDVPGMVNQLLGARLSAPFEGLSFEIDQSAYVGSREYTNLLAAMLLRTREVEAERERAVQALDLLAALLPTE